MKWYSTIEPWEIENSYTLFPRLRSRAAARLVAKLLQKISGFLKYPVAVAVPNDIEEFLGNPEALRAVRLLDKLRAAGIIEIFFQNKHLYGDEPPGQITYARLKDSRRFGLSGKGADVLDRKATLWPTVGEAVERYAIEFHTPSEGEFIDSSDQDLRGPKVNIFKLSGFDAETRKTKPFGLSLSYGPDSRFRWVKAKMLPGREEVWAPLQWFSFGHIHKHCYPQDDAKEREPLLSVPITTGVAAGQTETDAIYRGLLEVIERDAFIIYWLNQIAADRIDPVSFKDPRFARIQKIANRYRLETHLLYLRTDVPAHTVACIIIDRSGVGPAVIVGAKTSCNLTEAAYSAWSDTLAQRGQYRLMMDNEKYQKWLDQFDGSAEKIGHEGRIYFWFQKKRLKDIETFISGKLVNVNTFPIYPQYVGKPADDLPRLLEFFTNKKYEVFYRELLDEKMKNLTEGLSVAMVRVPMMQPVYLEESLISRSGERLVEIPRVLGLKPTTSSAEGFNKTPHPFP